MKEFFFFYTCSVIQRRLLFWKPHNFWESDVNKTSAAAAAARERGISVENGRCLSLNSAMTARSILLTRQVLPLGHHLRRVLPVKVFNSILCTRCQSLVRSVYALSSKCAELFICCAHVLDVQRCCCWGFVCLLVYIRPSALPRAMRFAWQRRPARNTGNLNPLYFLK